MLISGKNVVGNKPIEDVHKFKNLGKLISLIARESWKWNGII
jgi:hypothetical protein